VDTYPGKWNHLILTLTRLCLTNTPNMEFVMSLEWKFVPNIDAMMYNYAFVMLFI